MKQVVGVVIALVVVVGGLLFYTRFPIVSDEYILIVSNQDFENQNWPGSGASFDPYIISGKTIYASTNYSCIEIRSTTVFFVIKDCFLESTTGRPTLILEDVRNAKVEDCTFVSRAQGILMFNVSASSILYNSFEGIAAEDEIESLQSVAAYGGESITITSNQVKNCRVSAFYLADLIDCYVTDNILSNSMLGMGVMECSNTSISGNEIKNSGYRGCGTPSHDGITLWRSDGMTIDDNHIHDNDGYGILFSWSTDCSLSGNNIDSNALGGISTDNSDSISITDCTIANNKGDGIEFNEGDTCTVETSYIHHNDGSGIHFNEVENGNATENQIEFNLLWGILMTDCLVTEESNNSFDSNSLGDVRED